MSKRIAIGGLLAVGLSLAMAGSAQAQHYHNGGHYHGGGGHYYNGNYGGGGYYAPVYRPVVVVPSYGYNSINSPYFGFGNSGFNNFGGPAYGYNRGYGYNNGYGYNSPGVLNIGYSRPGFGINFGTIIR